MSTCRGITEHSQGRFTSTQHLLLPRPKQPINNSTRGIRKTTSEKKSYFCLKQFFFFWLLLLRGGREEEGDEASKTVTKRFSWQTFDKRSFFFSRRERNQEDKTK